MTRWREAGVLDEAAVERIRHFEAAHGGAPHLRWPMLLALALGALLLGAGVLLFVSSQWEALSPTVRFGLVLTLVLAFHLAGAGVSTRSRAFSATLHAVGTVALGGGIFLAGQIFNMAEHWPAGVMLWALGAWSGWLVLRQDTQLFLAALLTPAWLVGEWLSILARLHRPYWDDDPVAPSAIALIALTYFTLPRTADERRGVFVWLGGTVLIPALPILAIVTTSRLRIPAALSPQLLGLVIVVAVAAPLLLSAAYRGRAMWMNAVAAGWIGMLLWLSTFREALLLQGWWALGALGLIGWGVREGRTERINIGAAVFAVTVMCFYFSRVMDKLGRSASLIGFGLLFLAGGWALERARRQLVRTARDTTR